MLNEPASLAKALEYMGIGMLGIFLVTLAIIGSIALLNAVSNAAAEKRKRSGAQDA